MRQALLKQALLKQLSLRWTSWLRHPLSRHTLQGLAAAA